MASQTDTQSHPETLVFPTLSATTTPERDSVASITPHAKRAKLATPARVALQIDEPTLENSKQPDATTQDVLQKLAKSFAGSYPLSVEEQEDASWQDRLAVWQGTQAFLLSLADWLGAHSWPYC